jgi:mRNA interferase MazF
MQKDFDSWNKEKKTLENTGFDTLAFHEREIWWCSIGINLGDEQDGKNELFERPLLVLKKFNKKICWVLPMTTRPKSGIYYHSLKHDGQIFSVILSQIRLVSVKRFRRLVRKISPHQFELIQNKIIDLLKKPRN